MFYPRLQFVTITLDVVCRLLPVPIGNRAATSRALLPGAAFSASPPMREEAFFLAAFRYTLYVDESTITIR